MHDIKIPSQKSKLHPRLPHADLGVQFGVRVWLSAPDADLHDAVHVFLDELIVI